MKKKYSTPYLLAENFQVDTAVASCGIAFNYADDDCYIDEYTAGKTALFFSANVCFSDAFNDGTKICYHGSIAGDTFFAS